MKTIWIVLCLATTGCASSLTLTRELPLLDRSAVQAHPSSRQYSKVMVLQPSGDASSGYQAQVASFERAFLRHGVTVISGAVTGRIVLDLEKSDRKTESAGVLTDIERALVMARSTGAEAILQIGAFTSHDNVESRFLVKTQSGVSEVPWEAFSSWSGRKMALTSGAVVFNGKLIDVASAEVVASFDVACAALWSLPSDFNGTVTIGLNGSWTIHGGNFPFDGSLRMVDGRVVYDPPEWERQGRKRCEQRIIERLIGLSLSKQAPDPVDGHAPTLNL